MDTQREQVQHLLDDFPGTVYVAALIDDGTGGERLLEYLDWAICHAPHRDEYNQLLADLPLDDETEMWTRAEQMDELEQHSQTVFACDVVVHPGVDGKTRGIVAFLASSVL